MLVQIVISLNQDFSNFYLMYSLNPNLITINPQINLLNIELQNITNLLGFNTVNMRKESIRNHKCRRIFNSWNYFLMGRMSLVGTKKIMNIRLLVSDAKNG